MQVFKFNPSTGKREGACLGHINVQHYGSFGDKVPEVKMPARRDDTSVQVATRATDHRNRSVTPSDFNCEAITFCTGKFRAGSEPECWEWVILVKPL
jgi:hypothetical protein